MNQSVLKQQNAIASAGVTMAEAEPQAAAPLTFALSSALATISEPSKEQAESIRVLRTHVMAQHVDQGRRALSICAVNPDAGCTLVAANLAVALSQIGVKTLLIDGDLRNPGIEGLIRPSRPVAGLQQCLSAEDGDFSAFIQQDVLPDLSVMYSGGVPPNPQELLAGDRFKTLMDQCLRDFQMTIIDTPPAMSCADSRRVSSVVGYSVVVARQHQSRITDIGTLIAQLQQDGAKVVGTVLREV
ncbi:CpsD/CapB family tyrosine-protein kinase [Phenylobacterium sp. LH3H17]|uniref:CpsD/CapB family tyrosine-protein kinase n=1 Tax=Phenylobacterium sp. LH3H17 TaxID=2903901 RepID=UPI0020C98999|nr:CpsD/CapB family tyrosine-protein kinase [Phenylobacterium sp. LH3H17]UTP40983.1 CpsD/CapB family tyrosine-protein kinase [Phenylobacterium sp. LH3H17]